MTVTATEAEEALWTLRVGDDWRRAWSSDDDLSTWDDSTVFVQVRDGQTATSTLIASSDVGDDVALIDLTGTTFAVSGSELHMHIDDADTTDIAAGLFWLEAQCEIDGDVTTFLPKRLLTVVDEVAVT